MAEITLVYSAPVHVTVDTEAAEVTEVHVDDESSLLQRNRVGFPETDDEADEFKDVLLAARIAGDAMWPEWEFGF